MRKLIQIRTRLFTIKINIQIGKRASKPTVKLKSSHTRPVRVKLLNLKPKAPTLSFVLREYLERRTSLRPRSRQLYESLVIQRLSGWMDLPIDKISRKMIEDKHREISSVDGAFKASKVQANMTMRVLRLLLNFARNNFLAKDGKPILLQNPVETLTINRLWHKIPRRQGTIPDLNLADWYRAVNSLRNKTARDYLLFVLLTGLRRREASELKWSEIDFSSRILKLGSKRTKNHEEHRLPLPSFLMGLLSNRYRSRRSDYVFEGRAGAFAHFHELLSALRDQCGCYFTIHDLRRTFLTTAERLGTPHYSLKRLANHSVGNDTTFGYLVIDVERLRGPMERISAQLLSLMKIRTQLQQA